MPFTVQIKRSWPRARAVRLLRLPWQVPPTEAACARLLVRLRAQGDTVPCVYCGGPRTRHLRCRHRTLECADCRRQFSVLAGTPLHRCRLPLRKILEGFRLLSRPASVSSAELSRVLGCEWRSASNLAHRIRAALAATEPQLVDRALSLHSGVVVPLRRDQGVPRKAHEPPRRVMLYGLRDTKGRLVVTATQKGRHPQQAFVERVAPGQYEIYPDPQDRVALNRVRRVLTVTHRRVSERWVRCYVALAAWVAQQHLPRRNWTAALALISATLRGPPRDLRRLPPPPTPH